MEISFSAVASMLKTLGGTAGERGEETFLLILSTSVQIQTVHQGFVDLVHFVRRSLPQEPLDTLLINGEDLLQQHHRGP